MRLQSSAVVLPLDLPRLAWADADGNPPSDLPDGLKAAVQRKLAAAAVAVIDTCGTRTFPVLVVAKPPADGSSFALRQRGGQIARAGVSERLTGMVIPLPDHLNNDAVDAFIGGIAMGAYAFMRYVPTAANSFSTITFTHPQAETLQSAFTAAVALATATATARDWINTPAGDLGPDELEAELRAMATANDLAITVHDATACARMQLGCLLGVGQGSHRAPRLVEIELDGSGPVMALCGKGVCFDTGGLNLKPDKGMLFMRKDMGGAACVAQAVAAAQQRRRQRRDGHKDGGDQRRVRAYLPLVENAIGPRAMRPGDVLTAGDGTTVEVGHTDAEGRLILADAIVRAQVDGCAEIITVATLTGAALVALGRIHVPLMGSDNAVQVRIEDAAASAGERVWRLPMLEEHRAAMRGRHAQMTNDGNGEAGAITAGAFMAHFAKQTPFAHLDISPCSWIDRAHDLGPAGATGVIVATLTHLIEHT